MSWMSFVKGIKKLKTKANQLTSISQTNSLNEKTP